MEFMKKVEKDPKNATINDILNIQKATECILEYTMGIINTNEYLMTYLINENDIVFEISIQPMGMERDIDVAYFEEIIHNIFKERYDKHLGSYISKWHKEVVNDKEVTYSLHY